MPRSLADWLEYIERQHPKAIDLGLERVNEVRGRLGTVLSCPILAVGGTNGKGSTCAMLEAVLRAAGYRTALYMSPHLMRYNERVRTCGEEASDASLCEAFAAVETARAGMPLTYFEFGTLAAFWLFARERPDAAVLEIGLGGRLDAVNALDADCAVVTSIAIDHVEYLGGSRDAIGREKAGIFRSGRPAVVGDPDPPGAIERAAQSVGARLLRLGREFGYAIEGNQWSYWGPQGRRGGLAHPALRGTAQIRNAAAALCALDSLGEQLPVAMQDVRRGLAEVLLPGRFQVLPGRPQVILDVAHNPEAAKSVADNLAASGFAPQTIAVCGMLRDKDIGGVLRAIAPRITRWHLASLGGPRGARADELATHLEAVGGRTPAFRHDSPAAAFAAARGDAERNDKIVVFGSFLTVGEVMSEIERGGTRRHG
ncbi:MAG: bifunctional folylpolyglutamate synthase/dihydrofolate synthase [Betaproteobacteria bacterium RIFCSPHIGHO2_12_FULL_69_13]|nr:MAG: bifunctional folylpolyglutamate synthase/dihydrofolate synthase [Betaproteobacteria bacterium RIFCSPHIGHO2_12_FULL_69_13]OGA69183.1 MAG: bifunctional folylpolyglutamate synthase/dihydrofolate synthase [Betaproteobacteria bacterium RIFCSPLOWO2_12_FULL_68_20]